MNRRGFCIFIDTVCEGAVPRVKGTTADDTGDDLGALLRSEDVHGGKTQDGKRQDARKEASGGRL